MIMIIFFVILLAGLLLYFLLKPPIPDSSMEIDIHNEISTFDSEADYVAVNDRI